MEKEVKKLNTHMFRSKFAIFLIIGFLALITYLLIVISDQLQQTALTTGSEASTGFFQRAQVEKRDVSKNLGQLRDQIGEEGGDQFECQVLVDQYINASPFAGCSADETYAGAYVQCGENDSLRRVGNPRDCLTLGEVNDLARSACGCSVGDIIGPGEPNTGNTNPPSEGEIGEPFSCSYDVTQYREASPFQGCSEPANLSGAEYICTRNGEESEGSFNLQACMTQEMIDQRINRTCCY